ncbi:MAG: hypothetical protein AAFV72_13940 [Cyanobacteria bacterium J06635_1]
MYKLTPFIALLSCLFCLIIFSPDTSQTASQSLSSELPQAVNQSVPTESPYPVSQKVIDKALSAPLAREYKLTQIGIQNNIFSNNLVRMRQCFLLSVLAYTNYHDGTRYSGSEGKSIEDRVAQHLKHIVKGDTDNNGQSFESPALGGLFAGWLDVHIAYTAVLAKHTPRVWEQLTADEKERIEWMMKAYAAIGHWQSDDDNRYSRRANGQEAYAKVKSPNISHGAPALVVAAHLFFGNNDNGQPVIDNYFQTFSFSELLNKFDEYDWVTIKDAWTKTREWAPEYASSPLGDLMQNGGDMIDDPNTDFGGGGTGTGVNTPYSYFGKTLDDPIGIYHRLADHQFFHPVKSEINNPRGTNMHIVGSRSGSPPSGQLGIESPYEGLTGMGYEFLVLKRDSLDQNRDRGGYRSEARYTHHAWFIHMTMRTTLDLLGLWPTSGSVKDDIERRFAVGTEDLYFRLDEHWFGRANGTYRLVSTDASDTPVNTTLQYDVNGAPANAVGRELWKFIKARTPPPHLETPEVSYTVDAETFATFGAVQIVSVDGRIALDLSTADDVTVTEPNVNNPDRAEAEITLDHFGKYDVWAFSKIAPGSTAFYLKTHGRRTHPILHGSAYESSFLPVGDDDWAWRKVSTQNTAFKAGQNSITLLPKESGVLVEKIFFTNKTGKLPAGPIAEAESDNAANSSP